MIENLSTKEASIIGALLTEYDDAIAQQTIAELISKAPNSFLDQRCGDVAAAVREAGSGSMLEVKKWLKGTVDTAFWGELMQSALPVQLAAVEAQSCLEAFGLRQTTQIFTEALEGLKRSPEHHIHIAKATVKTLADLSDDHCPYGLPSGGLEPFTWDELTAPVSMTDNLLGNRFLERGKGFLLFGPAGCGKSVAANQACVEWSCGIDGLHIHPEKPLRIVILQTEDSLDDERDALSGILGASYITDEHRKLIRENLFILPPVPGGDPLFLVKVIDDACRRYKPDLINVNPLLAFCPGDPARELGGILYQHVDPIIKRHRVGFVGVHHTPKTNNRDTSGYGRHDHQYSAAGDARVANWPRAMMEIEEAKYPVYRFRISKRSEKSGWTWDGKPASERYFRQHDSVVRWVDAMPEEVARAKRCEDYRRIVVALPPNDQPGISRNRFIDEAKKKLEIGKTKAEDWLSLAIEDGLAVRVESINANNRKEALFRLAPEVEK